MAVEGGVRVGGLKEGHLRRTSTPSRGRCQYSDSLHTYEIATSSVAGKRYIFKFSWARNINFDSHEGIPTEPQRLNSVGHCYVHMWHTRTVKEGFKECIRFVYISLVFPPFYGFAAENRGRRCPFFFTRTAILVLQCFELDNKSVYLTTYPCLFDCSAIEITYLILPGSTMSKAPNELIELKDRMKLCTQLVSTAMVCPIWCRFSRGSR